MILLDTSAWIEIFRDTDKGRKALETLKSEDGAYACVISIAEISSWADKNRFDPSMLLQELGKTADYVDLDRGILQQSGLDYNKLRKTKEKISLIDAIIYTTAAIHGLKLLTCDRDFEGLPDVILI